MSVRRAVRTVRLPIAVLVVACAFTCSAGASRSAFDAGPTTPPVEASLSR